MNLPTYSLIDSPTSSIQAVCLGSLYPGPSPSAPSAAVGYRGGASTPTRRRSKGKGKGKAVEPRGADESGIEAGDEWENTEYRRARQEAGGRAKRGAPRRRSEPSGEAAVDQQEREGRPEAGYDTVFATAMAEGWAVYETYPLKRLSRRVMMNGSLKIVLPLYRTNILFLVGGPPSPLYSPNKVVIYDVSLGRAVTSLEYPAPVLGLAARRDRLIVVLPHRISVIALSPGGEGVRQEGGWETTDNPRGLVALASGQGSTLLVFPGRQVGQVQIVHLPPFKAGAPVQGLRGTAPPYPSTSILVAHSSALAALAVTPRGTLVATASVTGTLVRLWDPATSQLVRELRRGTDGAEVWSIRFRPDEGAVAVSSDKGTVHVWWLSQKPERKSEEGSRPVSLSILKPYLPRYFHSQWSDAYFRLPPPAPPQSRASSLFADPSAPKPPTVEDDICLVSWVQGTSRESPEECEPQVVALTRSGGWYRLAIPPSSGEAPPGSEAPKRPSQLGGLGPEKGVKLQCVEYRRFGGEDWTDGDEEDDYDSADDISQGEPSGSE